MAIVEAFKRSRHMLLQVESTVITDHLNLTYWMEPRQLSPRQARWVELLSTFRFKIVYRPGKYATMPDALSRRADYHAGKGTTIDNQYNFVQALPKISDNRQMLPKGHANTSLLRALQRVIPLNRDYFVDNQDLRDGLHLDPELAEIVADMSAVISIPIPIGINPHELPSVAGLRRTSQNPGIILPRWTNRQFLSFNDKIYVPNHNNSRLKILRARHDSPVAGHPGIVKTISLSAVTTTG